MYRKRLGSACQSVGKHWPRRLSRTSTPYSANTSETPPVLSAKLNNESLILKWIRSSSWMPPYISNWEEMYTDKMMTMYFYSEITEQTGSMDLISLVAGSLQRSHHCTPPMALLPLIPNCFSIKLKALQHASATVNKSAASKLTVCQSIIPLVRNFTEGLVFLAISNASRLVCSKGARSSSRPG